MPDTIRVKVRVLRRYDEIAGVQLIRGDGKVRYGWVQPNARHTVGDILSEGTTFDTTFVIHTSELAVSELDIADIPGRKTGDGQAKTYQFEPTSIWKVAS